MLPRFMFALAGGVIALGLAPGIGAAQQAPLSSVTVTTAVPIDYTLTTKLPGRIKASTIAEVRPQVSGIIRKRLFEEGADVAVGEPLYTIEDETYAATVAAAKASVSQAQANYDLAVREAERADQLFANGTGSEKVRDNAEATRSAASAALQLSKAQLTSAEIDLDRTTIRSPIAGVIGLSQTTTGALVSAQQANALATIRTLDPVYVDVTQSANDLMRWTKPAEGRGIGAAGIASLILPNNEVFPYKGDLKAAEPQVEPTTGMVTLRISIPNPDHTLLPGLYVEVEIPQASVSDAILVPQNAVTRDAQGGAHAMVVEDGKVAVRDLEILTASENNWVVTSGLRGGDKIITSGFQKIAPGAPVQIVGEEQAAPAASSGQSPSAASDHKEG